MSLTKKLSPDPPITWRTPISTALLYGWPSHSIIKKYKHSSDLPSACSVPATHPHILTKTQRAGIHVIPVVEKDTEARGSLLCLQHPYLSKRGLWMHVVLWMLLRTLQPNFLQRTQPPTTAPGLAFAGAPFLLFPAKQESTNSVQETWLILTHPSMTSFCLRLYEAMWPRWERGQRG